MNKNEILRHTCNPGKWAFTSPVEDRYFEDYVHGSVHEFGSIAVEESEMIDFARRFGPQPFLTDPVAAKGSIFVV